MVDAGGEGRRRGGTHEGEMPFEEVGGQGGGVEVGGGLAAEFGGFAEETLRACHVFSFLLPLVMMREGRAVV